MNFCLLPHLQDTTTMGCSFLPKRTTAGWMLGNKVKLIQGISLSLYTTLCFLTAPNGKSNSQFYNLTCTDFFGHSGAAEASCKDNTNILSPFKLIRQTRSQTVDYLHTLANAEIVSIDSEYIRPPGKCKSDINSCFSSVFLSTYA